MVPDASSRAAGSSFSSASFSRRSDFQSSTTAARTSPKGWIPAGRSARGRMNAGPREVAIGVVEMSPTLSCHASVEKSGFAPIPAIGPLRENQSVEL